MSDLMKITQHFFYVAAITFLILIASFSVNSSYANEQIDITKNIYSNLICDGIANDTPNLQKLIDKSSGRGSVVFNVPNKKICAFSGRIFMRSGITFHFQNNSAFAGGSWVYVSRTKETGDGPKDISWVNCKFISTDRYSTRTHILIRASNVKFKDCVWDRVFRRDSHIIDIGGSSNILIDRNDFIGSRPGLQGAKDISKEAIQADYAWEAGMTVSESDLSKAGTSLIVYNNKPSRDITVINSRFIPSYNADGSIESFPPPPFGVHGTSPECLVDISMCIGNVQFINNYILDIVDMGDRKTNFGILHWRMQNAIAIKGNTFSFKQSQNDYIFSIQIPNVNFDSINIDIYQNVFIGMNPRKSFFIIKSKDRSNAFLNARGHIRVCDNKFYIDGNEFKLNLLNVQGPQTQNVVSDCRNLFRPLREAPMQSR